MPSQTTSEVSALELGVMDAMDALTGCPECEMGTFTLSLYHERGRIVVECGLCGTTRSFADSHKPAA